jgi:hypothetical protein
MAARFGFLAPMVLLLTIASSNASAQIHAPDTAARKPYRDRNLFEITAGWGFYSPSDKVRMAYIGEFYPDFDYEQYGGIGVSFRALFAIRGTPLKVGGEFGAFTMRSEGSNTGLVYAETGDAYTTDDFLNGCNLQFLVDLLLFDAVKIVTHTEIGIGYLVFWDTTMGFGEAPFSPASEFMSSAKLVFSIPISQNHMIDPQFILSKGFSDNDILVHHIYIGWSILW